jgi:hypothetical protein
MSNYKSFLISNGNEIAVIAFLAISFVFIVIALSVIRKILYRLSPAAFKYIDFISSIRHSLNNGSHRLDEFNHTIYAKYYNNGFYLFLSRIIKLVFSVFFIKNKESKQDNYFLLDLLFENDRLAKESVGKGYRPVATVKYPYIYFTFHGSILSKDNYLKGVFPNKFTSSNSYNSYDCDFLDDFNKSSFHDIEEELNRCPIDDFGNANVYDDVDVSNAMND